MLTATRVFAAPVEKDSTAGWMEVHPRYRTWLRKCGLTSARDVLALRGEVVGGHADRHVVKVELHNGVSTRAAFLKREHVVGRRARYRNWLANFGWVSRAEREARTLQKLEALGLPGPQWLAYGENADGRAFLLIEELTGAIPLRELIADYTLSADELRLLAERLGKMLAEFHAAGIGTPELAAKHILVRPGILQPILIDWQSSLLNRAITPGNAAAWFGALHATVPEGCVGPRVRLRLLWAYRRVMKASGNPSTPRAPAFASRVRTASRSQLKRSSVRQQLGATGVEPQRLVWLDGEAVVAIPGVACAWPENLRYEPFYGLPPGTERSVLPCGTPGQLTRFQSFAPFGRAIAALRERPWRSPAATAARVLFHLRRFGIAGPKLLAFGQRRTSRLRVDSFVVVEAGHHSPERRSGVEKLLASDNVLRNRALADIGQFLKRLHDAGCRFRWGLLGARPLLVAVPELTVASALAIALVRRVSVRHARSDLALALAGLDRLDKMRVLRSYLGSSATEHSTWDRFAGAVL